VNWTDIVLIVFIVFGIYSGYKEGFLMELFSLLGIFLGVIGGFKLMGWAMVFLGDRFNVDQKVLPYFGFAVVFIAIVIIVNLLGRVVKLSVDKSFLGKADQVAGAILGVIKTIFMLSVAIWILESLKIDLDRWRNEDSWVYKTTAEFAPATARWMGEVFPFLKDIF
jgi:membrane protein required for colicin V production